MSEPREIPVKGKNLIRVKYNRNSGTVLVKTEGSTASTAGTATNRATPRGAEEAQAGGEQSDLTPERAVSAFASAVLEQPPVPPKAVWVYCAKMYDFYSKIHLSCIHRAGNAGVEIESILGPQASRLKRPSVRKRGRQVVALYMSELKHSITETSSAKAKMHEMLRVTISTAVNLVRITSSLRNVLIKEDEDELPGQEASLPVNVEEEEVLGAAAMVPLDIPTAAEAANMVEAERASITETTTKTDEQNQSKGTRNEDIKVLAALIQGFGELEESLVRHHNDLQNLSEKEHIAAKDKCREIFDKIVEEFSKLMYHLEEMFTNVSRCIIRKGDLQSPQGSATELFPDPPASGATSSSPVLPPSLQQEVAQCVTCSGSRKKLSKQDTCDM